MQGTLLKWTNYYNGWQPRHFVLSDTGVLSYYKSKELIHEGCKGSCLVLACEVKAHPNDPLRFDLLIPGEQFFCLKARSQPDRQHWLVALGSCKARGTKSSKNAPGKAQSDAAASQIARRLSTIDGELKVKVQELRLYETVLMQRIHAVKAIVTDTPTPDVQRLDDTTSLLSVTCDAFIQTLDECIQLATGTSTQSFFLSPTSSISTDQILTARKSSADLPILSKQIVYRTLFSELQHPFSTFAPLAFQEILSADFLSTCEEYLPFIDKLNSTTFLFYRSDINANISVLANKYQSNPKKFARLNAMLADETTPQQHSATDALRCLQRNLDFLGCFLGEFSEGNKSVEDALNKAYGQTLKQFHDWKTRELFSIALKSGPSNEDFFLSLAVDGNGTEEVLFERQILNEMNEHSHQIQVVLTKLNPFLLQNEL